MPRATTISTIVYAHSRRDRGAEGAGLEGFLR